MGAALESSQDGGGGSLQGCGTHPGIYGKNVLGLHRTNFEMNGRAKDAGIKVVEQRVSV